MIYSQFLAGYLFHNCILLAHIHFAHSQFLAGYLRRIGQLQQELLQVLSQFLAGYLGGVAYLGFKVMRRTLNSLLDTCLLG